MFKTQGEQSCLSYSLFQKVTVIGMSTPDSILSGVPRNAEGACSESCNDLNLRDRSMLAYVPCLVSQPLRPLWFRVWVSGGKGFNKSTIYMSSENIILYYSIYHTYISYNAYFCIS